MTRIYRLSEPDRRLVLWKSGFATHPYTVSIERRAAGVWRFVGTIGWFDTMEDAATAAMAVAFPREETR